MTAGIDGEAGTSARVPRRPEIRFALNAIQWVNVLEDPSDPDSRRLWRYADPSFIDDYPAVLAEIRSAGFAAVMMEVLSVQTLQNYAAMLRNAGLEVAPGYLPLPLPSDHGVALRRGTPEWVRWFDLTRRRAEESNFLGLDTVFVSPDVDERLVRMRERAAVGAGFDQHRLDEFVELVTAAAEVLAHEGIRAGLHNHVGTWVETESEIDYVLANVDPTLLGASFDIGHLEWAGIDSKSMLAKWSDRVIDLHLKDLDLNIAHDSRQRPRPYGDTADQGLFIEPGLGQIDLAGVLDTLPEDFAGWVIVEVDRASMDPAASARQSAAWVAEITSRRSHSPEGEQ